MCLCKLLWKSLFLNLIISIYLKCNIFVDIFLFLTLVFRTNIFIFSEGKAKASSLSIQSLMEAQAVLLSLISFNPYFSPLIYSFS